MENQKIEKCIIDSKIGKIAIFIERNIVHEIQLNYKMKKEEIPYSKKNEIITQVLEYLDGNRKEFTFDILMSGTPFEQKILTYISTISYGKTVSYKKVADECGYPNAYRAVGTALRKNKLPLVIPCHRVIKSDGSIGGYNGGENIKSTLLQLEKNVNSN